MIVFISYHNQIANWSNDGFAQALLLPGTAPKARDVGLIETYKQTYKLPKTFCAFNKKHPAMNSNNIEKKSHGALFPF